VRRAARGPRQLPAARRPLTRAGPGRYVAHAALQGMVARDRGHIFGISSVAGCVALPRRARQTAVASPPPAAVDS
jgi:hypothetical protein